MILIGKNNVISSAIQSKAVAVYSNREIDEVNFDLSNEIFITAMDPNYKYTKASLEFEKKLVKLVPKHKRVIYVSTLRLIDDASKNSVYCINKKYIETFLRENLKNILTIRLPVIVSNFGHHITNFQNIFSKNLKKNIVNFDVPKHSKYNFLTGTDLKNNFERLISHNSCGFRNVYNKNWYTAYEIADFFQSKFPYTKVTYGSEKPSYSSVTSNEGIENGVVVSDSNFALGMLNVKK